MKKSFLSLLLTLLILPMFSQETRLLRFPTIHDNQVVFTYAGDLYTVNKSGGVARKLTNDPQGFEMFARFSPNGSQIAFTGQYDGNTEVYVMPAKGGEPKRLTYTATLSRDDISDRMGPNNIVMSWTPDGKNVLYRSRKQTFNSFTGQLFSVNVEGGLSAELPLNTGSWCSYSPDGKQMAINRVMREFRTWKYYKGGMADDVWIFDIESGETTNITNNVAQDIFPMWYGDKIFFCSDRDRVMNIFCYNVKTKSTHKVTKFDNYDVKFPSAGNKEMIFENGGYLYTLDPNTEKLTKMNITINEDFATGRNKMKDASKNIGSIDISPDGSRLVIVGRGDVYTVPAKSGITRNITESSNAHDRNASWSPDGKYIAYISDMNGEFEIYIQEQDGLKEPVKLTDNTGTYIFNLQWSPDSKKILYSDKMMRLKYVDVDTKKVTEITRNPYWEIRSYDWSPDSKWIAYSHEEANDMSTVQLYSLDKKESYPVTNKWYSSYSPLFSNDGKYLFFTSDRDFNPTYSSTEWNHIYDKMGRVYFVTLAKDTPNPLGYENDEVKIKQEESPDKKSASKGDDKKETAQNVNVKIDIDGINDRIIALPFSAGYYGVYACVDGNLYYTKWDDRTGSTLRMFKLSNKSSDNDVELGKNMRLNVSADNKKALISSGGKHYVVDLPKGNVKLDKAVDLSNMKVVVDNKEEWSQIYFEAWRQMRDFFYVENMHGVDWPKMRDKYAELLPYVNCKDDLNYLIGELIGELNVGHAYINGGDKFKPERINMGLLGAKLERDKSGYYKIDKILKGENFRKDVRSPLTEVGMNINEGDFIVAVNGKSTKDMNDIYESLINTAGKEIILSISKSASESGKRDVIVVPIADEANLYYYTWVQDNIKKVEEATNGQVGYIHIPDMGVEGLNEFAKYFYPQLDKKALIIDDRGNGGGNVSPMILERLGREITRANMSRNQQVPSQTPTKMMLGPKVLLIDNYSASDGDLFPYGFRKHNLGTIIGVRSWGGIVGIRGSLPFVDGTSMQKPEFTSYDSNGTGYIIEGHGVEPDIWMDLDPYKAYHGEDAQLNKAIEVILEQLKDYKGLPEIPEDPIR
ncbi:PDZ domain-containing protein [Bacteroidales bacterium OttesenSCG-928-K03]|nr:PDZ domain-containing protein [Odoribacter sp. OttesenSCG-928-L07]MDL2239115.1 PDZ domain-containing protein [Bacteroidales bacterium OttesenSCG-928-L14]MDL2240028.1 PDZ domain-containing protein [Bacteroidales bacterium OttesenSCG-928-K22]MDL2242260.1 PDZ domain-containing protein [Bacteroidales bacterium OttesenSCG-928-K03]